MIRFPKKLQEKLARREAQNALRRLPAESKLVDFSSNDYLGFAKNTEIFEQATKLLAENEVRNGATGSRLISGNHAGYDKLERLLSEFHRTESALIFNSGYDANIGFFGSVPQRGDIVFYDEYVHASIRDGIKMGNAKSYKFKHNDLGGLQSRIERNRNSLAKNIKKAPHAKTKARPLSAAEFRSLSEVEVSVAEVRSPSTTEVGPLSEAEVYVVTESVFSMDGDSPDLRAFSVFCKENNCRLVVDEAHAIGVFGEMGEGLVQHLNLQDAIFARIVTFGKAMGCHGAAILGSNSLKDYLVNYARSFIYTTGLPPHSVATICSAYEYLDSDKNEQNRLRNNIRALKLELETLALSGSIERSRNVAEGSILKPFFIPSDSAIHCCVVKGNEKVRSIAEKLQKKGFDIRPILSPTVPEGQERLRICLHSFNTQKEISTMLEKLSKLI